jgi:hypothetical protein
MNKSTTRGFRLNAEELEPRLPPANDLFAVPTADAGSDTVQLRFEWGAGGAAFKNEIGIYAIDDAEGRVDGFLPSDPGYAFLALSRAQVVFARGAGIGAKNELTVAGDQLLGLYLVSNNTTFELLTDPAELTLMGDLALKHKFYAAYHTQLQGGMTAFDQAFASSRGNSHRLVICLRCMAMIARPSADMFMRL